MHTSSLLSSKIRSGLPFQAKKRAVVMELVSRASRQASLFTTYRSQGARQTITTRQAVYLPSLIPFWLLRIHLPLSATHSGRLPRSRSFTIPPYNSTSNRTIISTTSRASLSLFILSFLDTLILLISAIRLNFPIPLLDLLSKRSTSKRRPLISITHCRGALLLVPL